MGSHPRGTAALVQQGRHGTMSSRRLLLLLALALSVVAGSYVVARRDALSRAASAPRASAGLEEPAAGSGGYGMWTTDESLAFWRERVERDPRDYLSLTFLGQAHLRKARETGEVGAYARAEAALRQALAINPRYETAQAYLSAALFVQHDFRGALDLADRVYRADPRAVQALATLGDAHLELGDYAAAEATYRELAERAPGPAVSSRLARLAWLQGRPDEAARLMGRAVEESAALGLTGEGAAWYQLQLGELSFGMGRVEEAGERYAAAERLFPGYYLALAGLGKVRAAEGRLDEAIDLYERAIARVPQPDFLAALGDVYAAAGRPEEAARQYETVEFIGRLAEINQVVYNRQLALFWANHERRVADALQLAEREFAVRRDVYGADALAWALHKNGRDAEAVATIEQ